MSLGVNYVQNLPFALTSGLISVRPGTSDPRFLLGTVVPSLNRRSFRALQVSRITLQQRLNAHETHGLYELNESLEMLTTRIGTFLLLNGSTLNTLITQHSMVPVFRKDGEHSAPHCLVHLEVIFLHYSDSSTTPMCPSAMSCSANHCSACSCRENSAHATTSSKSS